MVLIELQEDQITWLLTADGQYLARSVYALQTKGSNICRTAEMTWKTKAPPKCRFFMWLLLQNRVWTAAPLQLRGWPNDYFCLLCVRNLETAAHLFMECCVVRNIWERVTIWTGATCLAPANWIQIESLQDWILLMVSGLPTSTREALKSLIMLVIWEIWKERNNRVFRKSSRSVQQLVSTIQDEAKTWAYAGTKACSTCCLHYRTVI